MNSWLREHLVCPRDKQTLEDRPGRLRCASGHEYPVVDGVPVLLPEPDFSVTSIDDPYYISLVNCSLEEQQEIRKLIAKAEPGAVDPVVQYVIAATGGFLYAPLQGKLREYPIPVLRLPPAPKPGMPLLDIGCNWGRWSMAAARKGYCPVGIDPSLGAVMAARRVAKQLGLEAQFVIGDARQLPFAQATFERVFSYSVLQHFSKSDVATILREVSRVLMPGGETLIQMANALGIRSLQHQIKRGFHEGRDFDVRYWTLSELRNKFTEIVGESSVSVDGYFGLGIQASDVAMMPAKFRAVIRTSEALRRVSEKIPLLAWVADSLYIHSKHR